MPTLRKGTLVQAVLTDFDRTLALLFDDRAMKGVCTELVDFYARRGVPANGFRSANAYTLWVEAFRWMRRQIPDRADAVNQEAAGLLGERECQLAQESCLFVGVHSVLKWLHDLAVPVAVVSTNVTRAVEIALKVNQVDHLVSVILGREEDRVEMDRLKPDPTLIHEALGRIDCGPALLIGDSVADMAAGRSAGLPTVGVTSGECTAAELTEAGAELVIPTFAGLRDLFVH